MSGNQLSFARRAAGCPVAHRAGPAAPQAPVGGLLGRFMRENKQEYPCKLIDISVGGAAMMSPVVVDDRRAHRRLFRPHRRHRGHGRARVRRRLRHQDQRHRAQAREACCPADLARQPRRAGRRAKSAGTSASPRRRQSHLQLAEGIVLDCRVLDISISGASIATPGAARDRHARSCSASCARASCATTPRASASSSSTSRTRRPCGATSAEAARETLGADTTRNFNRRRG